MRQDIGEVLRNLTHPGGGDRGRLSDTQEAREGKKTLDPS